MSIIDRLALPPLRIVAHDFVPDDLIGGDLAIDLVNTAAGLNRDPRDWLDGFDRLLSWARLTSAWHAASLDALTALAAANPPAAEAALMRVRELRAALYELLRALHDGRDPPRERLDELAHWYARAASTTELYADDAGIHRRLNADRGGLDLITFTVAEAAMALVTSLDPGRLRICGGRNCGWLFVDQSAARRRRWCDMKTCGNAAKAQRHYARRMQKEPQQ
jgi:predicted RNA-binding Zn ribbon-like protein